MFQYAEVIKWLADNKTSLENIQNAAKLPALKQLLLECNIGTEKDSSDILVSFSGPGLVPYGPEPRIGPILCLGIIKGLAYFSCGLYCYTATFFVHFGLLKSVITLTIFYLVVPLKQICMHQKIGAIYS